MLFVLELFVFKFCVGNYYLIFIYHIVFSYISLFLLNFYSYFLGLRPIGPSSFPWPELHLWNPLQQGSLPSLNRPSRTAAWPNESKPTGPSSWPLPTRNLLKAFSHEWHTSTQPSCSFFFVLLYDSCEHVPGLHSPQTRHRITLANLH